MASPRGWWFREVVVSRSCELLDRAGRRRGFDLTSPVPADRLAVLVHIDVSQQLGDEQRQADAEGLAGRARPHIEDCPA